MECSEGHNRHEPTSPLLITFKGTEDGLCNLHTVVPRNMISCTHCDRVVGVMHTYHDQRVWALRLGAPWWICCSIYNWQ